MVELASEAKYALLGISVGASDEDNYFPLHLYITTGQ